MSNTRPYVPGIIFGAGNKLRAKGPFLDLYVEFRAALSEAQRVIIIGYGFVDEHVNELLRQWVERPGKVQKLIRVSDYDNSRPWAALDHWRRMHQNVRLEVVRGRAATTIDELVAPTPALLLKAGQAIGT
jgi:hypothetical protein